MARRVLVTGASGRVARQLLPGLGHLDLRLLDRTRPEGFAGVGSARVEVLTGDLTDRGLLARAVDGVEAVVHLAGDPRPTAEWDELEPANVDAFAALLGAATQHGVRRVVYASSVHAMGQYEAAGRVPIDPEWAPSPCCAYGATKAFDEALARVYGHRTLLSTVGLRLGATVPAPTSASQLPSWLGPEDLRQLVTRALDAEVQCGIYAGVSANTRGRWDLTTARAELGYAPVLDSEAYADSVEDDGVRVSTCPPVTSS
jgi:NAD+ dependent glucose-6-phosphate dehydrogenase